MAGSRRFRSQRRQEKPSVEIREPDVADDHADVAQLRRQRGAGRGGELHPVTLRRQDGREGLRRIGLVLDEEDVAALRPRGTPGWELVGGSGRCFAGSLRRQRRELDQKARASARSSAVRRDLATVQLDHPARDRQPESQAAFSRARRPHLLEAFEDSSDVLLFDPDPVVADLHDHRVAVVPGAQRDVAARRRELQGVLDQVGEGLPQAGGIGVQAMPAGSQVRPHQQAAGGRLGAQHFDRLARHRMDVGDLAVERNLAARDPAHVEQIVDEACLSQDIAPDDLERSGEAVAGTRIVLQAGDRRQHRRQGGSELVAQGCDESIFGSVHVPRGPFRLFEARVLALGPFLDADVEQGDPEQVVGVVGSPCLQADVHRLTVRRLDEQLAGGPAVAHDAREVAGERSPIGLRHPGPQRQTIRMSWIDVQQPAGLGVQGPDDALIIGQRVSDGRVVEELEPARPVSTRPARSSGRCWPSAMLRRRSCARHCAAPPALHES